MQVSFARVLYECVRMTLRPVSVVFSVVCECVNILAVCADVTMACAYVCINVPVI